MSGLRVDELAAHYRDLERRLLPHWDAPLINDFLAMIFFGLLRKSLDKWCPDSGGGLENDLIGRGHGLIGDSGHEMISAEPAARIRDMAQTALGDPAFVRALADASMADIARAMDCVPIFRDQFRAYGWKAEEDQCFARYCERGAVGRGGPGSGPQDREAVLKLEFRLGALPKDCQTAGAFGPDVRPEYRDDTRVRCGHGGERLADPAFCPRFPPDEDLQPGPPVGCLEVGFVAGEVPMGETTEFIIVREGLARQILSDGKIGVPSDHKFYEVCTAPHLYDLVAALKRSQAAAELTRA